MPEASLTLEELAAVFDGLAGLAGSSAAIGTRDEESGRLARVLEYGSIAGEKPWPRPGPRTTLAVHPETGKEVVVSAQAPQGFIRVNVPAALTGLRGALARPTDWLDASGAQQRVAEAVSDTAEQALATLRTAVPRDSGQLADSLAVGLTE